MEKSPLMASSAPWPLSTAPQSYCYGRLAERIMTVTEIENTSSSFWCSPTHQPFAPLPLEAITFSGVTSSAVGKEYGFKLRSNGFIALRAPANSSQVIHSKRGRRREPPLQVSESTAAEQESSFQRVHTHYVF